MSQKIRIWETSISLLIAYEILALGYKKAKSIRTPLRLDDGNLEKDTTPTSDYANYHQSFALLILNASIIEGTIRSILSERISSDIDYEIEKGKSFGQEKPSRAEELLYKFREEVELQGGWEKLKSQYKQYLEINLDKITNEETREGINTLFALRNILSHGTAIIQPSIKMDDELKNVYPFNWQTKIQRASVYLKSKFSHEGIFENLAEFEVPEHFMEITKTYLNDLKKAVGDIPERAKKTIEMVDRYSFGYINYSR
ncbi:hypothetical protein [Ectopseudomonas mendocina]|uniref:MAE-28990/MAE-18760-like HEPN domain-containing protein n=1 Tax=Ectopseudomonas mendocina TaxID=300 RepID=A0A2R3QIJ4_ECTME|nr:hypothetical protein [Pseudomonas mendocina]AVO51542.1 hypothetical protein C7A17_01765 [Pseudomonas mendocina]